MILNGIGSGYTNGLFVLKDSFELSRLTRPRKLCLNRLMCRLKIRSTSYFCKADAEAAADKLHAAAIGSYHKLDSTIEKVAKFGRGRPTKGKPRPPTGYEHQLNLQITPDPELVEPLRMKAVCFVLVSNLDNPKDLESFSASELLRLYKNQDGIERNFSF